MIAQQRHMPLPRHEMRLAVRDGFRQVLPVGKCFLLPLIEDEPSANILLCREPRTPPPAKGGQARAVSGNRQKTALG
jgi:hypothetical protein